MNHKGYGQRKQSGKRRFAVSALARESVVANARSLCHYSPHNSCKALYLINVLKLARKRRTKVRSVLDAKAVLRQRRLIPEQRKPL